MAIILASKSPRRQALMGMLGVDFSIMTEDIDETMSPDRTPDEEVARLSREKAQAVCQAASEQDVIIAADTVVVLDGQVMGKPKDRADALRMLRALSGRTHQVLTGMTVRRGAQALTRVVTTEISFRDLTDREIMTYIETGEPLDKAGAYGIQEGAALFVSRLEGDFYNVMGLPVCTLALRLRQLGVPVLGETAVVPER